MEGAVKHKVNPGDNLQLWSARYSQAILFASFLTMTINYIYFSDNSVSLWFLISHFIVILLFLRLIVRFYKTCQNYSPKKFEKRLFRAGIIVNISSVLFFYVFYYLLTNTEFDAAAVDALWYHDMGIQIAGQFRELRFDLAELGRVEFDDLGYNFFLGIIYFIFGPNVIIARIIQALFGSFSAIIIYRIAKVLYNESIGRTASLFFIFFPVFVYYNALHLKETLMLYFTLLSIHSIICLQQNKNSIKYIFQFFLTIVVIFSFRTVLAFTVLSVFFLSLLISKRYGFSKKMLVSFISVSCLLVFLWQIGLLDEISRKLFKYVDRNTEGSVMSSTAVRIANNGQTFAKYASGPLILVQSVSFPYPSMVKTNISFYNQAAQWYHISGLFIWGYFSYWALLGIYDSVKQKVRDNLPLLAFTVLYSVILVITLYITTVRFNILKIAPMLIFVAVGLNNNTVKRQKYWYIYIVWISLVILIWNYVKVAGRGMI